MQIQAPSGKIAVSDFSQWQATSIPFYESVLDFRLCFYAFYRRCIHKFRSLQELWYFRVTGFIRLIINQVRVIWSYFTSIWSVSQYPPHETSPVIFMCPWLISKYKSYYGRFSLSLICNLYADIGFTIVAFFVWSPIEWVFKG